MKIKGWRRFVHRTRRPRQQPKIIGVVAGNFNQFEFWYEKYELDKCEDIYKYLHSRSEMVGRLFDDIECWGEYWKSPLFQQFPDGFLEICQYMKLPGQLPHGHVE